MDEQQEEPKRPQQSGMEQQHEKWVLATLNFLMAMDIPVHRKDERGNRIKGDLEIPERLGLVTQKLANMAARESAAHQTERTAREKLREAEVKIVNQECTIKNAARFLKPTTSADYAVRDAHRLLSNYLETKNQPTDKPEADHKGVKKFRFDVRDVMVRLGLDNLAHDIGPNERLCPSCWGLGLLKNNSPYGLGKLEPGELAFPYRHEWLMACNVCYLGKVGVCKHCDGTIERWLTACKCKAVEAELAAEKHKKEADRRVALKRIPLAEYEGDLLWADGSNRFVAPDSAEDYLEDHPDEVFFACKPMKPSAFYPEADEIIERMQERAYDECQPEDHDDEILEYSKEAVAELDTLLTTWCEKHVSAKAMWYQDSDVIVEVPCG